MAQKFTLSAFQKTIVRIAQVHFVLIFAYTTNILVSEAWNLIQRPVVLQRSILAAAMFGASLVAWYGARVLGKPAIFYRKLVYLMIAVDILVATVSVYGSRGMSSRSVMLYVIPIAIAGILTSRVALFATATISASMYALAAGLYFMMHPGEGYTVELYSEVGLYAALLFVLAALIWVISSSKKD